ncbi:MAG: HAD-IIB family hydrolase [Ruminococcaceae bacterium]|nr:HAD-IIB family hydrolase [Oscillospiraceae bacterium]
MKSGYLLFFDLDGTVLRNGKLPEENRKALIAAKDNGNYLVINSGRSKAYVPKEVLESIPWDGMICGSVYVQWQDKVLLNRTLSEKTLRAVLDYVSKKGTRLVMEGVEKNYSFGMPGFQIPVDDDMEGFLKSAPKVSKVTFLEKLDPKEVPNFPGLRTIFFKTYAEGIAEGYTKKTGMERILAETGIDREKTCAFGDSENDREMLAFAHLSAVMPEAPAAYDAFVTYRSTCARHGVADSLMKLEFISE